MYFDVVLIESIGFLVGEVVEVVVLCWDWGVWVVDEGVVVVFVGGSCEFVVVC